MSENIELNSMTSSVAPQDSRSTKQCAIIILSWNALPLLRKYLPSVVRHTPTELADIILADNGSDDGSKEYAHSLDVEVLRLEKNYGFAEGYNRAIRALHEARRTYPLTLLLNNDVRVEQGWLTPLLEHLELNPTTVAVQPAILSERDPKLMEYAGAMGGYLDILGYPFCKGRIFETIEPFQKESVPTYPIYPSSVFWCTGACMLIRTDGYLEVGGFDERFFAHQEEIDLAWRLHRKGYNMAVVPSSVVYHLGGGTLNKGNVRKTFLNFRNNLLMLRKNLPTFSGIRVLTLTLRFFLDLLAAITFLFGKNGYKEAHAVLRAWGEFFSTPERIAPEDEEGKRRAYGKLYHHFLLIRYHLFREKTFSALKK